MDPSSILEIWSPNLLLGLQKWRLHLHFGVQISKKDDVSLQDSPIKYKKLRKEGINYKISSQYVTSILYFGVLSLV